MKKSLILSVFILSLLGIFFSKPINLIANSAQIEETEFGSFAFAPIYDEDISVASELLQIDFRDYEEYWNDYYYDAPIAKTTATYEMLNAGETKIVKMGFAIVSNAESSSYSVDLISHAAVTKDGVEIIPTKYFGEKIYYGQEIEEMEMDEILSMIYLNDVVFEEEDQGTLITFEGSSGPLSVELRVNSTGRIFFTGFNSMSSHSYQPRQIQIGSSNPSEQYPHIYVVGDILALNVLEGSNMISTSMSHEDYLDFVIESQDFQQEFSFLLAHEFKKALDLDLFTINSFFSNLYLPRLMMLVYDVELIGGSVTNNITVEYVMLGSWSNRMTPTIYSYVYLTNPAKNYAAFGDLTVELLLPESVPHLIESSLLFEEQEQGIYLYVGTGLPETNLSFVICSSDSPVQRSNPYVLLFFLFIGLLAIPIIVGGVGVYLLIRSIRNDRKNWKNSGIFYNNKFKY